MDHTRKMTIVPYETSISPVNQVQPIPNQTLNKKKPMNPNLKFKKVLQIVIKLAKIDAYDDDGRIRSRDGTYLENSNIINLINYALSYGTALIGENEFISLLKEAKIEPSLIINENIKQKLISKINESLENIQSVVRVKKVDPSENKLKRNLEVEEEEEIENPAKKIKTDINEEIGEELPLGWEIPKKRKYDE